MASLEMLVCELLRCLLAASLPNFSADETLLKIISRLRDRGRACHALSFPGMGLAD